MKKFIMELTGTFFFIFTIAITANPFAIAAMLMAWVYIGGYISGAHYNPMVSLAVALRGRLNWSQVPKYMLAQILAGFAAFALTSFLTGHIVTPKLGAQTTLLQAFIVETLLAFVLALIILYMATSQKFKDNYVFGLAIGFTIPALAIIGGPISGGLFNPAIAIGSMSFAALKGIHIVYEQLAMYVGGAFLGGFLAAYFFKFFNPQDR